MALTVRQDGQYVGGQPNNATAAWWNDYYNLLTGAMTDQDVTLKTDLVLAPIGPNPAAPTLALAAGTALGVGVYQYGVTFLKQGQTGESTDGAAASITTTSGNQAVSITNIPTGPSGTIGRNLYRTKAGGSTFYLLTTLNNNTATTYSDTTADTSLSTTTIPPHSQFGGRLIIKNTTGAVTATLDESGSLYITNYLNLNSSEGAYINHDITNHWTEYKSSGTGAASGHVFSTWDGTYEQIPFSIGGQFASARSWIDNLGVLNVSGILAHPDGPNTDDSLVLYDRNGVQATLIGWAQNGGGMYAYDHVNNNYIFTQATATGITFGGTVHTNYGGNTTGVLGQITSNGGGAAGARIWVGTTDPGSLAGEGDIWIKA